MKKINTLLSVLSMPIFLSSCTWIYGSIKRTEVGSSQKPAATCDSNSDGNNYGGGSGTVAEPFLICSVNHLNKIGLNSSDWSKAFLLTSDLDLGLLPANSFNMIGTSGTRFTGVFDGGSKTISNLSYSTTGQVLGLIAYAGAGAVVKDVSIKNFTLSTDTFAGSIVGHATGGLTATNLSAKDIDITCGSGCGGIIGYANGVTASGGGLTATVGNRISADTDFRSNFGGFIGQAVGTNSFSNVNVNDVELNSSYRTASNVGGLAGQLEGSTLNQISVTALGINSTSAAGGLVGSLGGTSSV
ncbi:MAG: hypothetical protein WCL28_14265, partial [bacterium]